jgi:hypothetical protein
MNAQRGGWMYRSTFSLISALNGVDGQRHAPAALPPGKIRYALYRRLGWAPGPVWTDAENFTLPGFDPRTVQPLLQRYTD